MTRATSDGPTLIYRSAGKKCFRENAVETKGGEPWVVGGEGEDDEDEQWRIAGDTRAEGLEKFTIILVRVGRTVK